MVTGVSHSVFYKLCLLAELNRCDETCLWWIRGRVSQQTHPGLRCGERGTNGKEQLKQRRAEKSWRLRRGPWPASSRGSVYSAGWGTSLTVLVKLSQSQVCAHPPKEFGIVCLCCVTAEFKSTPNPCRCPSDFTKEQGRSSECSWNLLLWRWWFLSFLENTVQLSITHRALPIKLCFLIMMTASTPI